MRLGRNRFIDRRFGRDDYSQSSSALSAVVDAIRTVDIRSGRAVRTARRTRIEACEPRLVFDGALVISEFLTSNSAVDGLRDQDGTLQDWIEIRNTTAAPVNLAGWRLTDERTSPADGYFRINSLPRAGTW